MADLKEIGAGMFVVWTVQFLIGLYFHWDFSAQTTGTQIMGLIYFAARGCGYFLALVLAGKVMNKT